MPKNEFACASRVKPAKTRLVFLKPPPTNLLFYYITGPQDREKKKEKGKRHVINWKAQSDTSDKEDHQSYIKNIIKKINHILNEAKAYYKSYPTTLQMELKNRSYVSVLHVPQAKNMMYFDLKLI